MRWITRSRVHVDRVACPWLIKRFVDSNADFLFVPASQVRAVAAETGATPFDVPGAELGHHEGRCSFEVIIAKYQLTDPALLRLARIVHAADIAADLHTDEIAPGLEAIATGFGVLFPDDRANLEAQLCVYDALYAWCRLQVARESGAVR
jgi:hypothetical protein